MAFSRPRLNALSEITTYRIVTTVQEQPLRECLSNLLTDPTGVQLPASLSSTKQKLCFLGLVRKACRHNRTISIPCDTREILFSPRYRCTRIQGFAEVLEIANLVSLFPSFFAIEEGLLEYCLNKLTQLSNYSCSLRVGHAELSAALLELLERLVRVRVLSTNSIACLRCLLSTLQSNAIDDAAKKELSSLESLVKDTVPTYIAPIPRRSMPQPQTIDDLLSASMIQDEPLSTMALLADDLPSEQLNVHVDSYMYDDFSYVPESSAKCTFMIDGLEMDIPISLATDFGLLFGEKDQSAPIVVNFKGDSVEMLVLGIAGCRGLVDTNMLLNLDLQQVTSLYFWACLCRNQSVDAWRSLLKDRLLQMMRPIITDPEHIEEDLLQVISHFYQDVL